MDGRKESVFLIERFDKRERLFEAETVEQKINETLINKKENTIYTAE